MPHAIRIHQFGNADVLKWESVSVPSPQSGELRIKNKAAGLNFVDVYVRSGLYPVQLPAILGFEGSGAVEAVGAKVTGFKKGDRVAYATAPTGSYAEERIVPASFAVKLPDFISDEVAAAALLKGMTVEYLFHRTYPLKKGQTILFHAAAGGVGLIACQWAKRLGVTVIGTAGSKEKAALAKQHGCDHVILYRTEKIVEQVMNITNGAGVPVVYDAVGRDTFQASLDCLQIRGMLVSFGQSSGPVGDVNLLKTFAGKSLYYSRPSLFQYVAKREDLDLSAKRLFEMIKKRAVKIEINQRYALKDAAQAHRDLESRKLTGSTILTI